MLAESVIASRPAATEGVRSPALAPNALSGLRVLVIDDEPDARELVATVLRGRGAEVAIAATVAEAVTLLEKTVPHVLVSDIGMPVTDGYALLQRVRALGSRPPKHRLSPSPRTRARKTSVAL